MAHSIELKLSEDLRSFRIFLDEELFNILKSCPTIAFQYSTKELTIFVSGTEYFNSLKIFEPDPEKKTKTEGK